MRLRRTDASLYQEVEVEPSVDFGKLREVGVNSITAACVHGLFTGPAVERLNAQPDLKEIVCTNTVPPRVAGDLDRLTVLSVAPLFAEAVRRIHSGESISSLFDA